VDADADALMWGFQLWVNLPAKHKLIRPRYQDIPADRVSEVQAGSTVRVMAGRYGNSAGPVSDIVTAPLMLDVQLAQGQRFSHSVPLGNTAFAYVFDGEAELGTPARRVTRGQLAVLSDGGTVSAQSSSRARFLLLAARPIGEPVARWGPFVMNTDAEIRRAIDDYRSGRLVDG
jgi:hypothetical protein